MEDEKDKWMQRRHGGRRSEVTKEKKKAKEFTHKNKKASLFYTHTKVKKKKHLLLLKAAHYNTYIYIIYMLRNRCYVKEVIIIH